MKCLIILSLFIVSCSTSEYCKDELFIVDSYHASSYVCYSGATSELVRSPDGRTYLHCKCVHQNNNVDSGCEETSTDASTPITTNTVPIY